MTLIHQARKQGISPVQLVESAFKPSNKLTDDWTSLHLITPLEAPEVWAAGVTYQRSREARNYEATEGKLDAKTFSRVEPVRAYVVAARRIADSKHRPRFRVGLRPNYALSCT